MVTRPCTAHLWERVGDGPRRDAVGVDAGSGKVGGETLGHALEAGLPGGRTRASSVATQPRMAGWAAPLRPAGRTLQLP
jgi:hypothetical protein